MLDLITRFENIKKLQRNNYPFVSGSISNIFIYNERCAKHEFGDLPLFVAPEVIEKKIKKLIN